MLKKGAWFDLPLWCICAGEENNEVLLQGKENSEKEKNGRKNGQRKIKKKKKNWMNPVWLASLNITWSANFPRCPKKSQGPHRSRTVNHFEHQNLLHFTTFIVFLLTISTQSCRTLPYRPVLEKMKMAQELSVVLCEAMAPSARPTKCGRAMCRRRMSQST